MSVFEYIMVLVSIIIGLGVTHILKNIVFLIQHKDVSFLLDSHTVVCKYFLYANLFLDYIGGIIIML